MSRPTSRFAAFCILIFAMTLAFMAMAVPAPERPARESDAAQSVLVAGGDVVSGGLVAVWTNGLAYAAADTNALAGATVAGIADRSAKAGDTVLARRGRFLLDADGAALKPEDFGKTCYAAGPFSVTTQAAASQDIAAGRVTGWEYGSDGTNNAVWVNVGW